MATIDSAQYSVPDIIKVMAQSEAARNGRHRASRGGDASRYFDLLDDFFDYRGKREGFWELIEKLYHKEEYEQTSVTGRYDYRVIEPARIYTTTHRTQAIVFGAPPQFKTESFAPQAGQDRTWVLEQLANNDWQRDIRLNQQVALVARDCVKFGFGIGWTTYDPAEDGDEQRKRSKTAKTARVRNPMMAMIQDEVQGDIAAIEAALPEEPHYPDFEMDDRVLKGRVNTRRISPWLFGCDPNAGTIETAQWISRMIYCRKDALIESGRFKMAEQIPELTQDVVTIRGSTYGQRKVDRHRRFYQKLNKLVLLHEIWERRLDGGWDQIFVADGFPDIIERIEKPYFIGHPASMLAWNSDGDEIFPQSDFLPFEPERRAEAHVMTKMVEGYAHDMEDITFVDGQLFSEEELWDVKADKPNRFIVTKTGSATKPIRDAVHQLQRQPKSQDALNFLFTLQRGLNEGYGQGPNQQLQAMKSDTSAREVTEISSSAQTQTHFKVMAGEAFVLELARKRLGLAAQFYPRSVIARLVGPEAAKLWPEFEWTEADVQDGLYMHLYRGSMQPRNSQVDFANFVQLKTLMAQDPFLAMNTDQVLLQRFGYRALMGAAGEALILESNGQTAMQNFQAAQLTAAATQSGGNAPPA